MKRLLMTCAIALPLIALTAPTLTADVRTRERTAIKLEGMLGRVAGMFGAGRAARDGIVSTTMVKGDRKVTMNDATGEIIDLSEERIYNLDMKRRTYTVTTFDELRRQLREAREKAEKEAARERARQKDEPAQDPGDYLDFEFDVKETGERKQIAGYDARQVILTLSAMPKGQSLEEGGGMVMTSDAWFGPQIAALNEAMNFDLRYWKQLQGQDALGMSADQMAMLMAMYPMVGQAMERLKEEGSKLEGTMLAQTMTFETVRSKAQMAEQPEQKGGGGIGGMLARRIVKKDDSREPRSTIFTIDHEYEEIATSVDAATLAIPEGFKQRK